MGPMGDPLKERHRRELARYLSAVCLDPDLRALARANARASVQGFELPPSVIDALCDGGDSVLPLLSEVLNEPHGGPEKAVHGERLPTSEAAPSNLDELCLTLAVAPHLSEDGQLMHAASLFSQSPEPDGSMRFELRLQPVAQPLPNGQMGLVYSGHLTPQTGVGSVVLPSVFRSAARHSDEAKAAATAALSASSQDRYARLVDLVQVLYP